MISFILQLFNIGNPKPKLRTKIAELKRKKQKILELPPTLNRAKKVEFLNQKIRKLEEYLINQ